MAKSLHIDHPLQNKEKLSILSSHVTDQKAMSDLVKIGPPIIFAQHAYRAGRKIETTPILIDGHHRARRAFLTGVETLDFYYLPKELAKLAII